MSILVKGTDFGPTEQVTSTKLDNLVDAAKFTNTSETAVSYTGSTGTCLQGGGLEVTSAGQLQVSDSGINTVKLANSSNKTTGVTFEKMQHISTSKILGRTTAGEGDVEEVSLLDENNMSSDSATAVATQRSIKAYVDTIRPNTATLVKTDAEEISISSENTYVDIPSMEVAITTKRADSTFLITSMLGFGFNNANQEFAIKCQYKVGSGSYTDFNLPDAAGSAERAHMQIKQPVDDETEVCPFTLHIPLVDPSYSVGDVLTFKLLIAGVQTTQNPFINKGQTASTSDDQTRTVSTLTVQEV